MSVNFDRERLILSVAANLKNEIERFHSDDDKAMSLIQDLVYHLAFKLHEEENGSTKT